MCWLGVAGQVPMDLNLWWDFHLHQTGQRHMVVCYILCPKHKYIAFQLFFFFYFLLKIPCWCNLFFTTEQGINTRNKVWVLSALGFCVKINHVCSLCGLVEQVREQRRCGHSCYLSFKAGKRYLSSFGLDKMIVALTQSTDWSYRFRLRLSKVWATKIQALGLAIIRQKSPEALKGKA